MLKVSRDSIKYLSQPFIRAKFRSKKKYQHLNTDFCIDVFTLWHKNHEVKRDDYYIAFIKWLDTEWSWKSIHKMWRGNEDIESIVDNINIP